MSSTIEPKPKPGDATSGVLPAHVEKLLDQLNNVKPKSNGGWKASCPIHGTDSDPSLNIDINDAEWILLYCFGCDASAKQIAESIGLTRKDLFPPSDSGGDDTRGPGLTLTEYAKTKGIPRYFLKYLSLSEGHFQVKGKSYPCIRIPYFGEDGKPLFVRERRALTGKDRFQQPVGTQLVPYGLWLLGNARADGYVVLVEGESDCHTLWLHGIPALGLPGATSWKDQWATYFTDIPVIYVSREPDRGGETLWKKLSASPIRDCLRLLDLGTQKDPSALYLNDPDRFLGNWKRACDESISWAEQARAEAEARRAEAWVRCQALAQAPDVLARFADALASRGVAGETRAAKLLYLILCTRFFERPVSAAVKGPSSAGKSYLVERVLAFVPKSAYYELSAMSERALVYSEEPMAHRFLVLFEAAGLTGDFASYLIRSLLSEGRIRYETVVKGDNGPQSRLIERAGPTGLLVTTTRINLHPENETRLFSIPVTDTNEQTLAVLRQLARESKQDASVDLGVWHALQEWLASGAHGVTVPYAEMLAELVPPKATRLRRDFAAVLALVRAHALLQQASRQRDTEGRVVATPGDYDEVRALVNDLVAEGVEASVSPTIRETVQAVEALLNDKKKESDEPDGEPKSVTVTAVAAVLKLDKSTAHRRVAAAISKGYLHNLEKDKGRPARLVLGDLLPKDQWILPPVDHPMLQSAEGCTVALHSGKKSPITQGQVKGCTVAETTGGINAVSSSLTGAGSDSDEESNPFKDF